MTWKNYPEVHIESSEDSSAICIVTSKGDNIVIDINCDTAVMERIVECWNACRKIAFPDAHIKATDDYIERLEGLRKDAVAMANA